MLRNKTLIFSVIACCITIHLASAAEPKPIPSDQFASLHKMVKPQPGESRFWEISWLLSLDEALQRGAREGKPVLIWSGAGGAPHTVC